MGITSIRNLAYPLAAIGLVSFVMSLIGLFIGIYCGKKFAERLRAELWGGVILIIIGIKVLIEHTC